MPDQHAMRAVLSTLLRERLRSHESESDDYRKGLSLCIDLLGSALDNPRDSASIYQFILNVTRHQGCICSAQDFSAQYLSVAKAQGRYLLDPISGCGLVYSPKVDQEKVHHAIAR